MANLETWCSFGWILLLVVALGYYFASSNAATTTTTDPMQYAVLLREDLPRYSFVELYKHFPFDCADIKYRQMQELERDYSANVYAFLEKWNQKHPDMFLYMEHIETCIMTLHDTMMAYVKVNTDVFRTFEIYSNDVLDWFDDLRRADQAELKFTS